jgi:glucose/arabinose dehydrogenase
MRFEYPTRPRVHAICGSILLLSFGALQAQSSEDWLVAPNGFTVNVFAEGLGTPAGMALGPDQHLYVTLSREGKVVRLIDGDLDGRADSSVTVIEDLDRPFGIAWQADGLWVAEMTRVIRIDAPLDDDAGSSYTVVVDSLPASATMAPALAFDPSGSGFFLSVGSSCNLCRESERHSATIARYDLAGRVIQTWSSGLRSSSGLAFHPETGELWATEVGRKQLGADLPPDELNAILRSRHYGWPFCYGARVPDPVYADPVRCDATEAPILTFAAGSTPLGIAFYDGDRVAPDYRGDLLVALHGSPDRLAPPCGVVRVSVVAGRPRAVDNFLTGWLAEGGQVRGRPVQMLVAPDGALYVSDDHGGRIWRVVYVGED